MQYIVMCTSIPTSFLCTDLKQSSSVLEQLWILRSPWFVGNRDKNAHDPLRTHHVEITWTEHETQITQREHTRFLYSVVTITRYYQHGRHFWRNPRGVQRFVGFFSWLCFSGADWLSIKLRSRCYCKKTFVSWILLNYYSIRELVGSLCIATWRYSCTNAI